MEFFDRADWLNREAPYAFQWDHFLFIGIILLIGVGLCFLLKNKDKKTIKIVLISIWAFYVTIQVFNYTLIYTQTAMNPDKYPFNIETMLPLHSCLMFMYVFPIAMFAKNRIIKTAACNFLVVVNMIMGFITLFVGCPPVGRSALSFFGVYTFLYHGIDVIVPLVMVVTRFYEIERKDIYYGISLFGIIGLMVWIFDAITGCDYFYFYDGHTFPVFAFISENVPSIVWTLIVTSCYVITAFVIHFVVIGIKYYINQRKTTKNLAKA